MATQTKTQTSKEVDVSNVLSFFEDDSIEPFDVDYQNRFLKVFITDSFMNKNWEREQINRLMATQEKKIEQLKNEVENQKPTE